MHGAHCEPELGQWLGVRSRHTRSAGASNADRRVAGCRHVDVLIAIHVPVPPRDGEGIVRMRERGDHAGTAARLSDDLAAMSKSFCRVVNVTSSSKSSWFVRTHGPASRTELML